MVSPCANCEKVIEAAQQGEIRGWLAGLNHREHCTGDETCACTLLLGPTKPPGRRDPPDPDDRPLIDLVEKK